jgi:hypothetical protein
MKKAAESATVAVSANVRERNKYFEDDQAWFKMDFHPISNKDSV